MQFKLLTLLGLGLASLPYSLAVAQQKPDTSNSPSGNVIMAPANGQILTSGSSFTITWQPSKTGDEEPSSEKVDLILLSGASGKGQPIATIATGLSNSGSYIWLVPADLKPSTNGYAVELVVEGSGAYSVSTNWGVQNDGYVAPTGTTTSFQFSTAKATGTATGSGSDSASASASASGSASASETASASASVTGLVTEVSGSASATKTSSGTSGSSTSKASTATGAAVANGAEGKLLIGAAGLVAALML